MSIDNLRKEASDYRARANTPGVPDSLRQTYLKKATAADQEADRLEQNQSLVAMPRVKEKNDTYISDKPGSSVADYDKWEKSWLTSGEKGGYTTGIPFDPNKTENNPDMKELPDAVDISKMPELNEIKTNPTPDYNANADYKRWRERMQLSTGRGLYGQVLTNSLMGFNHRMVTDPVPQGRDYNSIVFFVRPDLNLGPDNVENSRRWVDRIRQPRSSIDYSVMAALDIQWPYGFAKEEDARIGKSFTPDILFDNRQAFIPILTRLCTNISGFADNSVDSWISGEGVMREQVGLVDSTWELNDHRTISTTFNPMVGNPVENLITVWLEYMAGRKEGRFKKRMDNFVQRRVDYFSAIYSIKTDPLGRIVQFDSVCECYPNNNSAGARANQDMSKWSDNPEPITIQWDAFGLRYFDPLFMERFNSTVALCNPDMIPDPRADQTEGFVPIGASYLRKLTNAEAKLCNWMGYPHVDSERRKLDWYIYQEDYDLLMKAGGIQ